MMHVPPPKVLYAVTGFDKPPALAEEVVKAPEVSSRTANGAAVGDATGTASAGSLGEGSSTGAKEKVEGKVEEEKEEEKKADDGGGRELYDLQRRKNFQTLLDVRVFWDDW